MMLPRLALVGLALAILSVPARATETPAGAPAGAAPAGPETKAAVEPRRRTSRRRRVAARRPVSGAVAPGAGADALAIPGSESQAVPPIRPTFPWDGEVTAAAPSSPAPAPTTNIFATLFGATPAQPRGERLPTLAGRSQIDALIALHARINGVPEALVHRIVVRESKYNPRAVGRGGAMGLMQIKTATARGMGYTGGPAGLLDAETNLTYAVKYLAGAYRTAGGNNDLAVSHYARGYYYAAKRKGLIETASLGSRRSRRHQRQETDATPAPAEPAAAPSLFSLLRPADPNAAAR